MSDDPSFDPASAIAIVGMAGRFPQAPDIETFWANIREGRECLTRYSDAELEAAGADPALLRKPNYVKAGAPLEGMDEFDAGFFGFSPRDAAIMDPQHRHMLECAWEALEDAAIDPDAFEGAIGVFAGSGHNAYFPYNLLTNPALVDSVGLFLLRHTGNDKDFLATRISYCLKLTGPSLNIQTACSTSLVATHLACQSLLNSECDLALAGGATIELPHRRGYLYEEGEILSPDGHCRAFDAASRGTVFGSGVGVVALRRYADAVASGDVIHAVIRGSAINNDGADKVGYLAPSVGGQAACVSEALAISDTDPATISYVECHGTGTPVGDPIEVAALTQAFGRETDRTGYCGIGSVKTNIGHTDTAAGIASLMKVVKAFQARELPPSLNYQKPNPNIDFGSGPFYVNAALRPWRVEGHPRRAGVNSLGVGGTNAFVVLEEAPPREPSGPSRSRQILTISARSAAAVDRASERLSAHLRSHPTVSLADVAYTLGVGRRDFAHRRAVLATDAAEAAEALSSDNRSRPPSQRALERRSVAFLFPGGGAQYPNMGRELYEQEAAYRSEIDRGLAILDGLVDWDLRELLLPAPGREQAAGEALQLGSRSLPSLFITEYAVAKLLMSWGIEPGALLGHSMGECVAACLAGVFSVEDGLRMVLARGQLFETLPPGAMISVPLPREELVGLAGDELDVAVVNTPSMTVASGPVEAIDALEARLLEREVECRRIRIHIAAHSRMLEPILPAFAAMTRTIAFSAPRIPFLSNVTGTWITAEDATDPDYWVRHLRSTVQFSANLETLLADETRVLVEVAPGNTLASLTRAHPNAGVGRAIFSTLRHPNEEVSDLELLLRVVGRLWMAGVAVDWARFFGGEDRQRVPLPAYSFDHERHWIEPGRSSGADAARSLRKRSDLADWFYLPSWKRQPLLPRPPDGDGSARSAEPWLIFVDPAGIGSELARRRRAAGEPVVEVAPGASFGRQGDHEYTLRPDQPGDFDALWAALGSLSLAPRRILHLWTLGGDTAAPDLGRYEDEQALGFFSLLFLAQTIGRANPQEPIDVAVVSSGMQQVAGEPVPRPERATLLGPCQVITREMPGVSCRSIDVELPGPGAWQRDVVLDRLPQEVLAPGPDRVIAYRGHDRFVRAFEPVRLPEAAPARSRLRPGGVYLVSGGLGGLGLVLARHLAAAHSARLVLVGRSALPPRESWDAHLAERGRDDRDSVRIREVRALEEAGAEVMVCAADVASLDDMRRVVAAARERFGRIHGVFHTAGVLDDGIIQLKESERAAAVLSPKVRGTLVLDAALADEMLDFFLLYSSVSAFTGLAGQVDYAAANAFLDAFAHARTRRDGTPCVAVSWNAWQRVGMAVEMARKLGMADQTTADRAAAHPLIDRCVRETATYREYATTLGASTHWLLDEHRIKGGAAVLPGTGYVELLRGALAESASAGRAIEIRELAFLAPFAVGDDESRELVVVLERERDGDAWAGRVTDGSGVVHATATLSLVDHTTPPSADIGALRERCGDRELLFDSADDEHLAFGPRWNNRKSVRLGSGEALVALSLPEEFHDDCAGLGLHPALLDFATAGAQALISAPGKTADFYVPLSYGRLRYLAPLPPTLFSHVRLRGGAGQVATYDVTLYDERGTALCEIDEFVMRRVEDRSVMSGAPSATAGAPAGGAAAGAPPRSTATGNPILELGLEQGIEPEEGMRAIERILAGPLMPQVVVSSQDLGALVEHTRPHQPDEAEGGAEGGAVRVTRPSLPTAFVEPENDLQRNVARVWEEILGIEGIGIHDDFFDLGGHSLLLTQVLSRVRKQVGAEISLRALFEKRTVAGIAAQIEGATARGAGSAPALRHLDRQAYRDAAGRLAFPASFMQQRLWFLDQIEPGRAVYNITDGFRLRGSLDLEALQAALSEIVARHESLRTSFENRDGTPFQVVGSDSVTLEVVDLRGLPEDERPARAVEQANALARTAFDLTRGPLLRAAVFRLADDDSVLALNVHHIVCDGWSLALLFTELSAAYAARLAGRPSPLPPQEIQYGDYAVWQHSDDAAGEDGLAFWKEYLGGELPQLSLPFDHNRPPEASLGGSLVRFRIDAELAGSIGALAREEKASLFMTLLAAFQVFLSRISGDTDVTVGSPIANRDREEVRESIGFYTNTVVFRGDLSGTPTFREFLRATRESALRVLAHQEVPMERVVEAINPDRRSGDNPLFQVMFALQKAPESALSLPGIEVSPIDVHSATSKFDLLVEMQELPAGMQCFLEYATDLFEAETAARLVESFTTLLRELVASPDRPIGDAPLLRDAERDRILVGWNDTAVELAEGTRLHDLFAVQAAARPEATAVDAGGTTLSYAELDARSSQLAHYLQELGVGPDSLIGVHLERGAEMMVALLGALKSGAAYLPLDPSFPEDRIAYMIGDSRTSVILTQASLDEQRPASGATVVRLDADWEEIAKRPASAPPTGATTPEHLAYVIYTSGSTGRPKGVQIPHRAVVNFLGSMARRPGFGPDDRLLAVTTLSFDISVLELFLPLVTGGAVVIATRDQAVDGQELMELLAASEATVMQATPATWRLLVEAGWSGTQTLRKVLCGGEAWPAGLARELVDRAPEVWNMYGPTETTIWSTCARITDPGHVTIGTPIDNTRVYVLDRNLRPVPVGVAGELHVGGAGLARGYHEREELTAERFIPNPFGEGRLYKTGDRVKHRPDGAIQYLERIDNQVKVRGYRIELGEIEAVLEKHPAVAQPVVTVWSSESGDRRLAAYIVYQEGQSLTGSELRAFLRTELPDYMIPQLFVEMDALPLTANGKVNRRALPDPLRQGQADEREFVAPRTDREKLVAGLWESILGVDAVGLYDNFFDLGGHSLLSAQVVFQLEKATGHRISLRAMVFQNVQQIAAELPEATRVPDAAGEEAGPEAASRPDPSAEPPGEGRSLTRRLMNALRGRKP